MKVQENNNDHDQEHKHHNNHHQQHNNHTTANKRNWLVMAQDAKLWTTLEEAYIQHNIKRFNQSTKQQYTTMATTTETKTTTAATPRNNIPVDQH